MPLMLPLRSLQSLVALRWISVEAAVAFPDRDPSANAVLVRVPRLVLRLLVSLESRCNTAAERLLLRLWLCVGRARRGLVRAATLLVNAWGLLWVLAGVVLLRLLERQIGRMAMARSACGELLLLFIHCLRHALGNLLHQRRLVLRLRWWPLG